MPRHTLLPEDFHGFVSEVELAFVSSSRERKRLKLVAAPLLNSFYYSVWAQGQDEQQFALDRFEEAIEAYNNL